MILKVTKLKRAGFARAESRDRNTIFEFQMPKHVARRAVSHPVAYWKTHHADGHVEFQRAVKDETW